MRAVLRVLAGTAGAALLAAGLVVLSTVPYAAEGTAGARIRVSFRFTPPRPEGVCGPADTAGLGRLPVHMRNPEACSAPHPTYRLRLELDGRTVLDEAVRAGGARADRPVYVYRELPVEAGCRQVTVRFAPETSLDRVEPGEALELSGGVRLADRQVALVTLDRGTGELILVGEACSAPDPGAGGGPGAP